MSAVDEELWANLYIFCYLALIWTTSLAGNYPARPAGCSLEGRESGLGTHGWVPCCSPPAPLLSLLGRLSPTLSCTHVHCSPQAPHAGSHWERTALRGSGHIPTEPAAFLQPRRAFDPKGHWTDRALGLLGLCLPLPTARPVLGARVGVGVRTPLPSLPGAGGGNAPGCPRASRQTPAPGSSRTYMPLTPPPAAALGVPGGRTAFSLHCPSSGLFLGLLCNRPASTERGGRAPGRCLQRSRQPASLSLRSPAQRDKGARLATQPSPTRGEGLARGHVLPGAHLAWVPAPAAMCVCVYPSGAEWSRGPLCSQSAPQGSSSCFFPALCSQQPLGLITGSPPPQIRADSSRLFSQLLLRIRQVGPGAPGGSG